MTESSRTAGTSRAISSLPLVSSLVTRCLLGLLAVMVIAQAIKLAQVAEPGSRIVVTDFEGFHVVAHMIRRGELDRAYAFETMRVAQRAELGIDCFMPWTYPPPFNLVLAPFAWLSLPLSYLLFTGLTLLAYLAVLRRLAGEAFGIVLVALTPALAVTIACGQNGFLTGALCGLACLALMAQRRSGLRAPTGLALGLMVIKPHLAIGLGLYTLAARRWAVAVQAATMAAVLCTFATLAFGFSVWFAFLRGLGEARVFLEAGLYPMYRMVSIYACLLTLGLPAKAAFLAQSLVAVIALGMAGLALQRGAPTRRVLGLAMLAGLLVSPYAYDYDLPIAAIGLALVLPDVVRVTSLAEKALLLTLSWIACGWGLVLTTVTQQYFGYWGPAGDGKALSLGGAALLLLIIMIWRVLGRERLAPLSVERPALEGSRAMPA